MISGHNSGCLYAQALDPLGAAKDIDSVFKHHPELNPVHKQLSLGTHIEDVNHINCEMWWSDIISGCCDLPSAWHQGHEMALTVLIASQIDPAILKYAELFHNLGIDMLHPLGLNKYFGILEDNSKDSSQDPNSPPTVPSVASTSHILETVLPDNNNNQETPEDTNINAEDLMLTFEEALVAESLSNAHITQSPPLPIDQSAPPLPEGPGIHSDDYLLFKSHWIHKQTICRLVINKNFMSQSLNQLEHVHTGYTKVNKCIDMSGGHITDQNLFIVGDLFISILCSGHCFHCHSSLNFPSLQ
ncbi:hypothetical protein BDR06DRAFT_884358 [Suillus hirtellus]|nr:hypothetical protein BDR06DRAFT_884358 [Suillus hirtellus]